MSEPSKASSPKKSSRRPGQSNGKATPTRKGSILAALRRSPLVGADLDLARPREEGRKVDI